jgi:tetratricopeptide (TPR) repeat protein
VKLLAGKLLLRDFAIFSFALCGFLRIAAAASGADSQFPGFAGFLQDSGEYYRAITEYLRFIYLYPDDKQVEEARFEIGRCYLLGGQYSDAEKAFSELASRTSIPELRWKSMLSISEAYYKDRKWAPASRQLAALKLLVAVDDKWLFKVRYADTWTQLQNHNAKAGIQLVREMKALNPEAPFLPKFEAAVLQCDQLPRKSAGLAGAFSAIVPGAGQLYAGRKRDALTAFAWNALFIGGALIAHSRNHDETAVILGFVEIPWYAANIYNAVNDAHKWNDSEWTAHLKMLETLGPPPFGDFP